MQLQIRRGCFETNSSSVHSLTICNEDDFLNWASGEGVMCLAYGVSDFNYNPRFFEPDDKNKNKFYTFAEAYELLKNNEDAICEFLDKYYIATDIKIFKQFLIEFADRKKKAWFEDDDYNKLICGLGLFTYRGYRDAVYDYSYSCEPWNENLKYQGIHGKIAFGYAGRDN